MDVSDVIKSSVSLIDPKDHSTVLTFLVVMMVWTQTKMMLQWWEHMLVQPGPLKKKRKR